MAMRPITLDELRRRASWEAMRERFAAEAPLVPSTPADLIADLIDPAQLARQRHPLMALAWDLGSRHG